MSIEGTQGGVHGLGSMTFGLAMECAFGVVGNILMSRIQWNLFSKIWIQNVGDFDFKSDF